MRPFRSGAPSFLSRSGPSSSLSVCFLLPRFPPSLNGSLRGTDLPISMTPLPVYLKRKSACLSSPFFLSFLTNVSTPFPSFPTVPFEFSLDFEHPEQVPLLLFPLHFSFPDQHRKPLPLSPPVPSHVLKVLALFSYWPPFLKGDLLPALRAVFSRKARRPAVPLFFSSPSPFPDERGFYLSFR